MVATRLSSFLFIYHHPPRTHAPLQPSYPRTSAYRRTTLLCVLHLPPAYFPPRTPGPSPTHRPPPTSQPGPATHCRTIAHPPSSPPLTFHASIRSPSTYPLTCHPPTTPASPTHPSREGPRCRACPCGPGPEGCSGSSGCSGKLPSEAPEGKGYTHSQEISEASLPTSPAGVRKAWLSTAWPPPNSARGPSETRDSGRPAPPLAPTDAAGVFGDTRR